MKKYEELCFYDDFMFSKVLSTDPELCKDILELILGRKIKSVTCVAQKTYRKR